MRNLSSVSLLVGCFLIAIGILLLLVGSFLCIGLLILGIVILIITRMMSENDEIEWRALSDLPPEVRIRIIERAKEFAGLTSIQSVVSPKVNSSHTEYVNILGVDENGFQIVVGVDPVTIEAVKMIKLCPRESREATEVEISKERAKSSCLNFLNKKQLTIPENYILEEDRVASLGPWKRWRFVWRHIENEVRVLPDFILMEVNAAEEANIITYSKVDHTVEVDLVPKFQVQEAVEKAIEFMPELDGLELAGRDLAVVYPNNFFNEQVWEWSENQALCWILKFERDGNHMIDIWVDAATGQIHGGEVCHLHTPEVYGIDATGDTHMKSHLDNIWSPYFNTMKFDVSSFDWSNAASGFTEATISNAITNGRYFIVEGHGDVTATAEKMQIAYQGSADAKAFTPDEVPANNLRFVLLDTCQSGEDGTGADFKDTFISQGADVFIGFDDYMCAWTYEDRLLHYLAQGFHLANAHNLADADSSPWYTIVITYNVSCLNKVRLAPLLTTVNRSPAGPIGKENTFTVTASIKNREDVDHTSATNVQAKLVLPSGFSVTSGSNPQNVGSLNWNSPKSATWTVKASNTIGSYTLDVEVWSDNLGSSVDDPGDPYHRFDVAVVGHFHAMIAKIYWLTPLFSAKWIGDKYRFVSN